MGKSNKTKPSVKRKGQVKRPESLLERFLTCKTLSNTKKTIYIEILSVILAVIGIPVAVVSCAVGSSSKGQQDTIASINNGITAVIDTIEKAGENTIDPEKAALSFQAGIDLYDSHLYENAEKMFIDAIQGQEIITGASSVEVGNAYCMLGLTRIYLNKIDAGNGEDAITALKIARTIFERNEDPLGIAKCDYYLAMAYYRMSDPHMNIALEYAQKCANELSAYCPEDALQISYTADHSTLLFSAFIENEKPLEENAAQMNRLCQFYYWMQKTYSILGRIFFSVGEPERAFQCYNQAIEQNACLYYALHALTSLQNQDVLSYDMQELIKTLIISDSEEENSILVKYYSTEKLTPELEDGFLCRISSSSENATLLTNRAMVEYVLDYPENTLEDCADALAVWKKLPTTQRDNISFTYAYLSLAELGPNGSTINAGEFPEEKKKEILENIDLAVYYEQELLGTESIRYANLLYTRGMFRIMFFELVGLDDWRDAYNICMQLEDYSNASFIRSAMQNAYEVFFEGTQGFEDWINGDAA